MDCETLNDSHHLAVLIGDLEDQPIEEREEAYLCRAPSAEDPGRCRLWIVPRTFKAGATDIWYREHQDMLRTMVDRSTAHTAIVFPGEWPDETKRAFLEVDPSSETGGYRSHRRVRRDIRIMSAAAHLWIDRLRVYSVDGQLDRAARNTRLARWSQRGWGPEREKVFIAPKLSPVDNQNQDLAQQTASRLLENRPVCPETGFAILYGKGGAGKTFFLSHIAARLCKSAAQRTTARIPVFVPLQGVLHCFALENWLARNGFEMLTLHQLTVLLRHGVIVPILDALDEVVKGDARDGSNEFLDHVFRLATSPNRASGLLACRDYYLSADRGVVRDRAAELLFPQLSIGAFDAKDTRRYLQLRTDLPPEHASRWAEALEKQAQIIVGSAGDLDVIRHPVVLETLASYIRKLPNEIQVTESENFRLQRADVFGGIVDALLSRETPKHSNNWKENLGELLHPSWSEPFTPEKQRDFLMGITLLIAESGGRGDTECRHGLFLGMAGVPSSGNPREALTQILEKLIGTPEVSPSVPQERRKEVEAQALKHLSEAYSTHILALTDASRPPDLIFALRHRFYFEYFLSEALLEQIDIAIRSKKPSSFIDWCLRFHVADIFVNCLDFLPWHPSIFQDGFQRLMTYFAAEDEFDDVLASYLVSLALAVLLRRHRQGANRLMERIALDGIPEAEILLITDLLPPEIRSLDLKSCSFPHLEVDSIDLSQISVCDCDFHTFSISSARITNSIIEIETGNLVLKDNVVFSGCCLEIQGSINVAIGSKISFFDCEIDESTLIALNEHVNMGIEITFESVRESQKPVGTDSSLTVGLRFINKMMLLLRREGRAEFGVYVFKLRAKTPGTDEQFADSLRILQDEKVVERRGDLVILSRDAARNMYDPRLMDREGFDSREEYWGPISRRLDEVLAVE